jgi:hypothetical protein
MDDQTPDLVELTTPRSDSDKNVLDPDMLLPTLGRSSVDSGLGDHVSHSAAYRRPGSRAPLPRVAQHVPGYYLG